MNVMHGILNHIMLILFIWILTHLNAMSIKFHKFFVKKIINGKAVNDFYSSNDTKHVHANLNTLIFDWVIDISTQK
jgi:hypothetical protein